MADTQFTILGMSGSGKTCYLLGLYYMMGAGLKGYTITSDEDTDVELRDRCAKLCDASLEKEERFPAGTDSISKYEFDLQYGYRTIMTFDWVDYSGGLLDRKIAGNSEEYKSLQTAINNSSSLFICVGGELLVGDDKEKKIKNVKKQCSNVINGFISEYVKSNQSLPPTAIIVTKYDICRNDTDEKELREIINESFSPLFAPDDHKKIVTIIPVSIGINIMDDDYKGEMAPLNIHLPIFMGIWFALSRKTQDYEELIRQRETQIKKEVDNLRDRKAKEENKLRFFKSSKKESRQLAKNIQEKEAAGREELQKMNQTRDIMVKNSSQLIEELKKLPYMFVDGRESSFEETFQNNN